LEIAGYDAVGANCSVDYLFYWVGLLTPIPTRVVLKTEWDHIHWIVLCWFDNFHRHFFNTHLAAVQGFEIGIDGGVVRVGSKGKTVLPVVHEDDDVHDLLRFLWGLPSKMAYV
jgi:hypothetical protein